MKREHKVTGKKGRSVRNAIMQPQEIREQSGKAITRQCSDLPSRCVPFHTLKQPPFILARAHQDTQNLLNKC